MKTFTHTNKAGFDIFHMIGSKDNYTVSESNGTITYTNKVNGNQYNVTSNELLRFDKYDIQGKKEFKWDIEYNTIVPQFTVATGGTIQEIGNYRIHTFTASDIFTIDTIGADGFEVHLVGGGGGGGAGGGSAGAGGYTKTQTIPKTENSVGDYSIIVGAGGAKGLNAYGSSSSQGQEGQGSSISLNSNVIASVGNTTKSNGCAYTYNFPVSTGGSGGGGNGTHGGCGITVGITNCVNDGAWDGGDAGPQAFYDAGSGRGQGTTTRDWSEVGGILRSGGGGSGAYTWGYKDGIPGAAGQGGGGTGGSSGVAGTNGVTNYGGGGGAAGWTGNSSSIPSGGNGGSGLVMVRYRFQ